MDQLEPGVIVGGVIVLVVITSMLVATVVVVWRSRPAAIAARARKQRERSRTLVHEANGKHIAPLPFESPSSPASDTIMENKECGDLSFTASTTGSDTDTQSLPSPPPKSVLPHVGHSVPSALNVILAPRLLQCVEKGEGLDEGQILEKPPPAALGSLPSASGSAWWFM
ncbi:hypothetical protein BD309DRAFT_994250 [Dichomitus squalens]|uniref:Uncharacterized protein n=2 Tax=Dichomitus squalens TaxID=114155 RepID=A0A4Q9MMV2_9APHY|nr:uncharacterized protein DICSQDRAFT_174606 [Dichomitus squalens LYAD-421 SS1]EJF56743.1 hypothetical protein DICSQDRAFT_174606 [Dichomitus squalens LYAD-421 SS1]TBU27376.1 hypothetical protein BD311DRAFT_807765 [Dichomitus squalens]TBU38751.1 hypothetical protein BD309DRAFT_994250 [Dichomitus squalens]